ncbi:MAG: hypothetical protein RRB13_08965 [bacterium]|nr:hypothetical protein [bacterium]
MLDQILDYKLLIPAAVLLGLAPFFPEPHLVEKLRMLMQGELKRPIDIFDLFFHSWPMLLIAYKLVRDLLPG